VQVERIEGGDSVFLQSMVRFPCVSAMDSWWASFRRRIAAAPGLRDITSAYRLCVRKDGNIDRLFSAVFDPGNEPAARRFFGAFSLLEGMDEESVALPQDHAEFEAWANDFPKLRCQVMSPALHAAGDIWLACDFRVAPHLEMIEREAQALGFAFGYQIHFRRFVPEPERQRRIGRNLIALQAMKGAPAAFVADQERQMKAFAAASLLIEEIVAVDEPKAAEWLGDALGRIFRASDARAPIEVPKFGFSQDCGTEPALMMHSTLLYGDWNEDYVYCSQVATEPFRGSILSHRPQTDPAAARQSQTSGGMSRAPEPPPTPFPQDIVLPDPFEGRGHIFISYRRSDLRRIVPILQRLAETGRPIWYDRGISGGDEWDVVLERKIEEAALVLVFLSQATVESKYCRREIKFADAIDKPLLVVTLEATTLHHGLKFMLQQLQQVSMADQQFDAQLDRAIQKLLDKADAGANDR
jgi:TIR domain